MIKHVFFDLDDTLFDHTFSSNYALKKVSSSCEVLSNLADDELNVRYQEFLEEVHLLVLSKKVNKEEARILRFQKLYESLGKNKSLEEIIKVAKIYTDSYEESKREVPGSLALLKKLKARKVKVGIVTNNLIKRQIEKIEVCHFGDYIDFLVTSEDVGISKPSPEIFHFALKKAGCLPSEVVMIGDSWESDILGALNVGIKPIWLNRKKEERPNPLVESISSLVDCDETVKIILNG